MKKIIALTAISLLSLLTFAYPVDQNPRDVSGTDSHHSHTEHDRIQSRQSEKMAMSASDAAAYSRAQDLFLVKRKEYNEQKLQLMMVETGPVRRDIEKGMEYYYNNMDLAKRQLEVYEARFDTSGRSKLG